MARVTLGGFRVVGPRFLASSLLALGAFLGATSDARAADQSTGTGKGIAGGALLGGELVIAVEAIAGVEKPLAYAVGGILGAAAGGVGGYFIEQEAQPRIPLYMLAGGMALIVPTTILALNATSYKPPPEYQEDKAPSGTEPVAEPPRPATGAPPGATPGGEPPPQASPPPASTPPNPSGPQSPPPGGTQGGGTSPPGPSQQNGPQGAIMPRRAPQLARPTLHVPRTPMATSVVDLYGGSVRMGLPAVEVRPTYSMAEVRQYGLQQREEIRIPVFRATF